MSGTAISASPVNRPARIPRFAASNPGASAYARTSRNASSYGTRSGCATVPSSAATAPARAPQHPRQHRRRTPARRSAPRIASAPAAQATARPARSPSPTAPSPPAPSPARPSHRARSPRRRTPSGNCSRSAAASSNGVTDSPAQRRRSPEARHVDRHHIVSQQGQHGVPDAVVRAERMEQDERQERARINAVSTADPPATAAVLGAAPPGRPPRPIAVDDHVADVAGDRRRQQRLHRRVVQDRGDGQRVQPDLARAERPQGDPRRIVQRPEPGLGDLVRREEQPRAVERRGTRGSPAQRASYRHLGHDGRRRARLGGGQVPAPARFAEHDLHAPDPPLGEARLAERAGTAARAAGSARRSRARGSAPRTRPRSRASGAASRRSAG